MAIYGANAPVRQQFTGKERDEETGLDYFNARYFASGQGRFTSPDVPLADQWEKDPQSWNLYSYVRNNPLRFIDPTGRECVTLDNGAVGDNGQGKMCQAVLDADKNKKPDVTVSAMGGNQITAFALNSLFALDAAASSYFRPLTNAMGVSPSYMQPIPTNRGFTGSLATGAVFLGTMMISPGSGAGRVIRILEQSSGVVHVEVKTAQGVYEVMANVRREGSTLILDKAHIEGGGAGQFGTGMLREIREAARQFGREQGVSEVIVNPGVRTSGANPGHSMRSFRIEVN